jgi:hypothetical protein
MTVKLEMSGTEDSLEGESQALSWSGRDVLDQPALSPPRCVIWCVCGKPVVTNPQGPTEKAK